MKSKKVSLCLLCALILALSLGCGTENKKALMGTGIGVAAGAAVGAIIGHQTGNRKAGALWGAALGGTVGGVYGHKMDKQAKELEKIAETKRTEHGIITKLKGDILFSSGKAELSPASMTNIGKISEIVKKYPENRITVVGHTDSTGSDEINQKISEQRANSVRTLMISQGFPAAKIQAIGAGEKEPIADNSTAEGRQGNRRVELEIVMVENKQAKK